MKKPFKILATISCALSAICFFVFIFDLIQFFVNSPNANFIESCARSLALFVSSCISAIVFIKLEDMQNEIEILRDGLKSRVKEYEKKFQTLEAEIEKINELQSKSDKDNT